MQKLLLLIICFYPIMALSQTPQQNADEIFKEARDLANQQKLNEARALAGKILEINPSYHDARVLLARIHAWGHQFDSARLELKKVTDAIPSHRDAIDASIDVEIWDAKYYEALTQVNLGLNYYPNDKDFLMKKIKILLAMGREEEAREILAQLLDADPNNPEVKKILAGLNKYKNRIALEHTFEFFNKPFKYRWHMSSLQYQHDARWGSYLAKFNMGKSMVNGDNSFRNPDFQLEADAYPILNSNLYLYLNYGYSWGDFFPRHRAGLEPFLTLPHNWEVSAGGRFMYYNTNPGRDIYVYILTGSISKYYKSHWISFRPYYVFIGNTFAQSYYLYYRYYYKSAFNYLGGALGVGNSPDDPSIRSGDVSRLSIDSYRARIDFQHLIGTRFLFRSLTGVAFEKYMPDKFRPRFDATLYIAYLF